MSAVRRFTPEATVGPFFPGAFVADAPQDLWTVAPLVAHHPQGQPIVLAARFIDALKRPIPSLVVEVWQANAHGRYRHPEDCSSAPLDPQFDGFARLRTDDEGKLRFATIKPGAHSVRAPHLRLTIFASGIDRVVTQIFFDDEALNVTDPVLNGIPDSDVRRRLIARRVGEVDGVLGYGIEVVMRGDQETPFFDDWA